MKEKVGLASSDVWRFLEKHGPIALPDLAEKINRDPYLAVLSTG